MPSRVNDASMPARMCLRERPRPFGPGVIGVNTLVATTSSSRESSGGRSRPTTTSLCPSEYPSAVSKKVMPASTAARTIGAARASSSTHGRHSLLP
jgi:hypothetical protein